MSLGEALKAFASAADEATARALVTGALTAAGLPAPLATFVGAAALPVLRALGELLCKHEAGEPLPDVHHAPLPEGMATVDEQLAELLARLNDRPTDPAAVADTLPPEAP